MPRAAASTATKKKSTATVSRAKAPAKKAAASRRKPAARTTTAARKPRATKRAAKPTPTVSEPSIAAEVAATPTRKAPTRFAAQMTADKAKRAKVVVVGVLLVVGIGASAAVGFTDSGQIDVAQTIQERNERMANLVDVDGPVTVAPAPENVGSPDLPDGGLIGLKPTPSIPKTAKELTAVAGATSTASSTPNDADDSPTASSTTPVVDNIITHSATTTVNATSSSSPQTTE